jgi:hypothetical protein
MPEQNGSRVGAVGAPSRDEPPLRSGQLVMVENVAYPGYITGFRDNGTIGVQCDGDVGYISVTRNQIRWRQSWRGYACEPFPVEWPHREQTATQDEKREER